jgi:hypothetical protein
MSSSSRTGRVVGSLDVGDEVTVGERTSSSATREGGSGAPPAKHGAVDAAAALRADIERVYPPPPATTGVFARAVPHDRIVPENREARALRGLAEEIEKRTRVVEKLHEDTGARIEAWQELPKDSAVAVAEARAIAALVDEEIAAIEAVRSSVGRAIHAVKGDELASAKRRLEALKDDVERWHRDALADKNELLVHGRAVIEKKAGDGNGEAAAGASEAPLPVQAQRAMADAIERRREAEGNDDITRNLIDEEQRIQADLEKRLGAAIQAARDALVTEGMGELMSALDAVRAWGHSLAFEARRFKR